MSSRIAASVSRPIASYLPSESKTSGCYTSSFVNVNPRSIASSDSKLKGIGVSRRERFQRRRKWVCNSSGDNESKSVLDAFFLGKAIGEALGERIESTVGEVLGAIGRLQSEQQKQVQEFQEEVLERAKRAKEKAARESMEAQGLIARTVTVETASVTKGTASPTSSSTGSDVNSVGQPLSSEAAAPEISPQNPVSRTSNED